jgi:hypothetical protein
MGAIGKPIRKIDVQPLEEPDPTRVPDEPPVPLPEREKEPVENVGSPLR